MSASVFRACVMAAAAALEASSDELCRLDAAAGDGDHGMTMVLAARAVRQALAASPDAQGAELVTKLAVAMGSVGGASGPIYAAGMLAVAGTMRERASDELLTVAQMVGWAEAAEAAISSLGRAKPGDKTVLDALHPAAQALRQAESAGSGVSEALDAAAAAAREGAASSALMIASVGRASRLGERSRGLPDPGATSLAVILGAVAETYRRDRLT